jgi:hypothetical protein
VFVPAIRALVDALDSSEMLKARYGIGAQETQPPNPARGASRPLVQRPEERAPYPLDTLHPRMKSLQI